MIENVPRLAQNRRLRRLRRDLRALGYSSVVEVLDVADYGVPQRRKRMVLLASRTGPIDFGLPDSGRKTVRDVIGGLPPPGFSGDSLHDIGETRSDHVRALIAQIPTNGGSRTDLAASSQLACHKRLDGFKDIYGRMSWDTVAPTITSGCVNPSKGRFLHPDQDRAITLREAALLQGFAPDYRFSLDRGKFAAAAVIGNALPPEFARRQGLTVRAHLMAKRPLVRRAAQR